MTVNSSTFMKGNWEHLVIQTFSCKPEVLEEYLPIDIELDLYQGKALFSMVAFTFSKVSFFGIKVPFHQKFGEINFRFYTRSKIDNTKGVVFIREFAPKPLIAFVANTIYNEPFYYKKIKNNSFITATKKKANYTFNKNNEISVLADRQTKPTQKNSLQDFIVDRYIAFVKGRNNTTYQYKINHRPWQLHTIKKCEITNNIFELLPESFKNSEYLTTYFVDGSAVTIEKGILQNKATIALEY